MARREKKFSLAPIRRLDLNGLLSQVYRVKRKTNLYRVIFLQKVYHLFLPNFVIALLAKKMRMCFRFNEPHDAITNFLSKEIVDHSNTNNSQNNADDTSFTC